MLYYSYETNDRCKENRKQKSCLVVQTALAVGFGYYRNLYDLLVEHIRN